MKKLFTAVVAIFFMATTSFAADDLFYKNTSGQWDVFGHPGNSTLNPACVMQTNWNDRSKLLIIQDLADGELCIHFTNNNWNVKGPYQSNHELVLNFYKGNGTYASLKASFTLTNKNSIVIRGIKHEVFLDPFTESDRMVFVMPGDVPNVTVGLRGTMNVIDYVKECMLASKNEKLRFPKKGQDT